MDRTVNIRIVREDTKEFNIDGTDWRLLSSGLEGFGDFDNDIAVTDNAVSDGGIITASRLAAKDRTITAVSRNTQLNDVIRQKAISFFNPKYVYKVYVTYMGLTRWAEGTILKFSLPTARISKAMTLTVTFLFPNPYWKSFDDFGKDIAEVEGMVAFPYLCAVDSSKAPQGHTAGVYNFAKLVTLENDGDVETYCKAVFIAQGSVVNPELKIGDAYVKIIDTMASGDIIVMDFTSNPPTIKKNGKNFIGHCDRTSRFDEMVLGLGDTEISFDADNGSNLLQVSIYYNKLYSTL